MNIHQPPNPWSLPPFHFGELINSDSRNAHLRISLFLFPDSIPSFSMSTFVLSEGLTCRVIPRNQFARHLENNYGNITWTRS